MLKDRFPLLSRRGFLKAAGIAGAGTLLAPSSTLAIADDAKPDMKPRPIPTRTFGRTGVKVPVLSLGTMFDTRSGHMLMKQALAWGVTYWDTASTYEGGNSEVGIGQYFERFPEDRARVFLVTKTMGTNTLNFTKVLDESLERMKTDYVDMFFMHAVSTTVSMSAEMKEWAEKAKKAGKIRLFGISSHQNMTECMQGAARTGWIDGVMVSYNFRTMREKDMQSAMDACHKAGIGITAMKFRGGGPIRTDSPLELEMAGRFIQSGFTVDQAKLKAVWEDPRIASICASMTTYAGLGEYVAAALDRKSLSLGDRELLDAYAHETRDAFCAGCAAVCESRVDGAAPIGDVMRCLMYDQAYGNHRHAREAFAAIPQAIRTDLTRRDYRAAEAACPRGLPIGRLVEDAVRTLG